VSTSRDPAPNTSAARTGSYTPLGSRSGRRRPRRRPALAVAAILITIPFVGLGLFRLWPGFVSPPEATEVVFGGYACHSPAVIDEAGRVYLPYGTVKALFDPSISICYETMTAVTSTAGKTVQMSTASLTEFVNRSPVELRIPLRTGDAGGPYVALDFFAELLGLSYSYHPDSNTLVIDRVGETVETMVVTTSTAYIRRTPSLLSLRVSRLEEGDVVRVYEEHDGWYYVRNSSGRLGYIPKKGVTPGKPVVNAAPEPVPSPEPPEGRLCLVWEHVSVRTPDPADIGEMPGLQVISPTWFHVMNSNADVSNLGDRVYVDWAHERGYQVWGLVTNGFDRNRTRNFLPDPDKRERIIRQLLIYARLYHLDGLNMDFENMYLSEKDDYAALCRELAPLAREQGLALSADVTFLSSSEIWSRCFDRPALAEVCDYIMVMGYDEHTAGSPVSGPVGSLPWVERGLERVLEQVPAEKLILGVPFYTRLWEERPGSRPGVTTYSMQGVRDLVDEKGLVPTWDPSAGQYYITYEEGGLRYRLWIEDETSMAARLELIEKYGLAGVAAWRRGFEVPEIWELMERQLGGQE